MYGEGGVVDFHRWTVAGMALELQNRGFSVFRVAQGGGILFAAIASISWAIQQAFPRGADGMAITPDNGRVLSRRTCDPFYISLDVAQLAGNCPVQPVAKIGLLRGGADIRRFDFG
jgi:hypothetical protein